jgi:hypothetical protein
MPLPSPRKAASVERGGSLFWNSFQSDSVRKPRKTCTLQARSARGAVADCVAGRLVEQAVSRRQGGEIIVRLDNGRCMSVVQEVHQNEFFGPGDRVRILGQGRTMCVMP